MGGGFVGGEFGRESARFLEQRLVLVREGEFQGLAELRRIEGGQRLQRRGADVPRGLRIIRGREQRRFILAELQAGGCPPHFAQAATPSVGAASMCGPPELRGAGGRLRVAARGQGTVRAEHAVAPEHRIPVGERIQRIEPEIEAGLAVGQSREGLGGWFGSQEIAGIDRPAAHRLGKIGPRDERGQRRQRRIDRLVVDRPDRLADDHRIAVLEESGRPGSRSRRSGQQWRPHEPQGEGSLARLASVFRRCSRKRPDPLTPA